MRMNIPTYDLGRCYIGCFSTCEEVDCELSCSCLNIIHYQDGYIFLVNEKKMYPVSEEFASFFESLHDYDVLEIFENGTVRLQFSEYANENTLFITSKCNSNCVMCPSSDYSRKEGVIPEASEILELVKHYSSCAKHITITGGEPFLFRNSMFDVLSVCKERLGDTEFLLLTNGRVFCLDAYVEQLVQSMPRNTVLAIPIHGSTSEKHDAITRAPGSFTQTVSGITKLLAHNVPVEIRLVVTLLNKDDLKNIGKLIMTHMPSVYRVHFIGLEMLGNAARNNKDVWLSYKSGFEASKFVIDELISAGINVALYNFPLCAVEYAYWPLCKKSISEDKRHFPDVCQKCVQKHICGGVFLSSLRYAETDLQPFEE